jgi:hypothetical protein
MKSRNEQHTSAQPTPAPPRVLAWLLAQPPNARKMQLARLCRALASAAGDLRYWDLEDRHYFAALLWAEVVECDVSIVNYGANPATSFTMRGRSHQSLDHYRARAWASKLRGERR